MRTVEDIYISKLSRFASVLETSAAKGGSAAFSDILKSVEERMTLVSSETASQTQTENYDASLYTGYSGYTGQISSAASRSDIEDAVQRAAQSTGLEPALIRAVIQAESSFRTNAVSSAGAEGLMQLMPKTAKSLGVTDSFDVNQNVMGGSTYLKKQLERFGDLRLALAAYNTGPGRISSLGITNANDASQYETISPRVRGYVDKVLSYYAQFAG